MVAHLAQLLENNSKVHVGSGKLWTHLGQQFNEEKLSPFSPL